MTDLLNILIWELGRTTVMFLAWFWDSELSGPRLLAKIVICDQARVSCGSNYVYPGQRWVLKLVLDIIIVFLFSIGPNDTGYSLCMMKVFN